MKTLFSVAFASILLSGVANAQLSDPNLNCEQYMKMAAEMGPTPKTGDATMDKMTADIDTKMAAFCKGNPKANAAEALAKIMLQ
ncbi:MAG: hypothetical protein JWO64_1779 [Hyphomicrobiales bacterium]|jgi:hypothetical protein|nr:hypothetical protein [Hyphomicrobiales bacterium]